MAHALGQDSGSFTFFRDFLLGGVSGTVSKTICACIQRVKLLIQTRHLNPQLRKTIQRDLCLTRVAAEEGIIAFWRGNWANVKRYSPSQAINFSMNDALNRQFLQGIDSNERPLRYFLGTLLAGGMAGAIGMLIIYPMDIGRTRLAADAREAVQDRQFNGLTDCVTKIFKSDGIRGLALYFGGYDSGKRAIWGDDEAQRNASFLKRFFFAQFIVCSSETASYPLDTVRRRLMMQSGKKMQIYNKGTLDCFKTIHAKEGIKAFFKGNFSNMWGLIGSSLVLVFYDEFQKYFNHSKKAQG